LWAYARYARSSRPPPGQYIALIVLFALGLMCKPTLVTVPFVLLLLDYWPLRRMSLGSSGPKISRAASNLPGRRDDRSRTHSFPTRSIQHFLVEKIPLFVLSAASCFATVSAQERAVIAMHLLSFGDRIGNAL